MGIPDRALVKGSAVLNAVLLQMRRVLYGSTLAQTRIKPGSNLDQTWHKPCAPLPPKGCALRGPQCFWALGCSLSAGTRCPPSVWLIC